MSKPLQMWYDKVITCKEPHRQCIYNVALIKWDPQLYLLSILITCINLYICICMYVCENSQERLEKFLLKGVYGKSI